MYNVEKMAALKDEMFKNVTENILPFWCTYMEDDVNGGFYGRVDKDLHPDPTAPKSAVLNTRMLWAYSNAYEVLRDEKCKALAKRSFEYLRDYFWDDVYGGIYWTVGPKGDPFDMVKRTYAQASIIYSMSQYYAASKDPQALEMALKAYELVLKHAKYDNGGYADSVHRNWSYDPWIMKWYMNSNGAPKLLNSHLHLFEGMTLLFKVTKREDIKAELREFLEFLLNTCVDYNVYHLKAGMDMDGKRIDNEISFGHDLECAYLMVDAAQQLDDAKLVDRTHDTVLKITRQVLEEGMDTQNGGIFYERDIETGHYSKSKIWWAQCEAITGFLCAYELSEDEKFLDMALNIWNYVDKHIVDHEKGEWKAIGTNDVVDDDITASDLAFFEVVGDEKANKTKCPYHNSRVCLEVYKRVNRMSKQ